MDSLEVQEFLLATATNNSLLLETDNLFENPNNSTQSMYFSINDDTISNRIVDEMKLMEKTLTTEADSSGQRTIESTVIEEENFQKNLHLKPFPAMRSQCSTPKVEAPKPAPSVDIVTELMETRLDVLPLSTVLQKIAIEKKKTVTIIVEEPVREEAEDKENVVAKQVRRDMNLRRSLKPRDAVPVVPAKKPTLRKSMIPNAPAAGKPIALPVPPKPATAPVNPRPSLMARKSVRLSSVPNQMKASSRYTMSGRTGKINSPTLGRNSPRNKKLLGTIPKSSLAAHRMTINSAAPKTQNPPSTAPATAEVATQKPSDVANMAEDKAKKRMSRIPPPSKIAEPALPRPRADFTCSTCKKSFHLKTTLLTHQKIHTARPVAGFKCTYCDKDFEKEVGLRNHIERYCAKVPIADKRKLNGSHNRTTSAEMRDRSKKEKSSVSSSSRLESTTSSAGSVNSVIEQSSMAVPKKPEHETSASPRKAIKSISHPHSGIKFSANKPIKCYPCQITFNKYVDFHSHVAKHHPQPTSSATQSPVGKEEGAVEVEAKGSSE